MRRRDFNARLVALMAVTAGTPQAFAATATTRSLFYAGVGTKLYAYAVDPATRALVPKHGPYTLPQPVQAAWQNPRTGHLYVASSDGNDGTRHAVTAFAVGADGALQAVGGPVTLRQRPIHITVDQTGEYLLLAHPRPSSVSVYRIGPDGALAGEVSQVAKLDTGFYPHEIRMLPSNRAVLIMSRGVTPTAAVAEQPGSIRLFSFSNGQLSTLQTLSPNGGISFRPRNAEFDPGGRWVYGVLEAQNQVNTYGISANRFSNEPLFTATTLSTPGPAKPGQMLSASRIHPSGRFLYVVNRATGVEQFEGQAIANRGEDTIAVFSLDPATGQARRIQSADFPGLAARGMDLSRDGRWLVVAGMSPGKVRVDGRIQAVPEALSLFSVGVDGRLTLAGTLLAPSQQDETIWVGAVAY